MRRLSPLTALIILSLCGSTIACSKEPEPQSMGRAVGAPMLMSAPASAPAAAQNAQKRMAISHRFTLRLPAGEVERVQHAHLDACLKAGCSILNSQLNRDDDGRVNAALNLRIAPAAYDAFAALLAAPPATLVAQSETAEDKTLAVLDVEKRLQNKQALRDRLRDMLKNPGDTKLADLLSIEKELSEVQTEIETATAQQDYLRTLTETVEINIFYQGVIATAAGVDLSPISQAVAEIGPSLSRSVAGLILFVVRILPWLPLGVLTLWGTARLWRRWRRTLPVGK